MGFYENMQELLSNDAFEGEPTDSTEDYLPKPILKRIQKFFADLGALTEETGVQLFVPGEVCVQVLDGDLQYDVELSGGIDYLGGDDGGYSESIRGLAGGE